MHEFRTFKALLQVAKGLERAAAGTVRPSPTPTPKESPMNRNFNSTSPLLRSVFAAAAVFAMLATAGAIEALITHYSAEPQLASAQPHVIAQR
jgi:hypothetical protein